MAKRNDIKLGTHGEDYGNWMSTPCLCVRRAGSPGSDPRGSFLCFAAYCRSRRVVYGCGRGTGDPFMSFLSDKAAIRIWRARQDHGIMSTMASFPISVMTAGTFSGCGLRLRGALDTRGPDSGPTFWADFLGRDVRAHSKALCEKNAASEGVRTV